MNRRVAGAFAYLLARSLRNRFAYQARRLREVRYLVGLLFAGAYFGWLLFGLSTTTTPTRSSGPSSHLPTLGALALLLLVAWWWVRGVNRSALAFSPAEVHFLFSGPLHRADLLRLKILRAQPPLLLSAVLYAVFLGGDSGQRMPPLLVIGFWLLLTIVILHRTAAALARVGAEQHGSFGSLRRMLPLALLAAVLAALIWSTVAAWQPPPAGAQPRAYAKAALAALNSPLPSAVLAPFRAVVLPVLITEPVPWLRAAALAAAMLLLHYLWVTRTRVAFEEASVAATIERARRVEAVRTGAPVAVRSRSAPVRLPLAPLGHPAVAIVWKNLVAATAHLRVATLGWLALLAILIAGVLPVVVGKEAGIVVAMVMLYGVGMTALLGPVLTRNDLRGDLPRTELRTYPLSGKALVAAEIASSAAVFSAIQLGLVLLAYLAVLTIEPLDIDLADRTAILAAAVPLLPAIAVLSMTIQNGLALLFPAWTHFGPAAQGFEATGQRMLNTILFALLLILGLLVPTIVGVLVGALLFGWLGFWALPPAALAAAGTVGLEVWLLVRWLGSVWERMDPAAASG